SSWSPAAAWRCLCSGSGPGQAPSRDLAWWPVSAWRLRVLPRGATRLTSGWARRGLENLARVEGVRAGVALGDQSRPQELVQRTLERLGALAQVGQQDAPDLVGLAVLDHRSNRHVGHQHLVCGDPPSPHGRNELLVDDPGQARRKLRSHLLLLGSGEAVDDAVHLLRRVVDVPARVGPETQIKNWFRPTSV